MTESPIESVSAVTLIVEDMARSVAFYEAAGFRLLYGGATADFSSFAAGEQFLNLSAEQAVPPGLWGRVIFHVDDVDALYKRIREFGFTPDFAPSDAAWGERYFHIRDPAGHEISFARRLQTESGPSES